MHGHNISKSLITISVLLCFYDSFMIYDNFLDMHIL